MITVKNLNKTYNPKKNPVQALQNINLSIPSKQKIAVVGRSGSGKSTLMQVMSTLDKADSGEVLIDKTNILQFNDKQLDKFRAEKMGFIFQNFYVDDTQTCLANISLPLEILNMNKSARKRLSLEALERVGLEDKAKSLASELSGGQRQRLAIARAIVNNPKILFADEPTGNLDSQTGWQIIQTLFNLTNHLGTTFIMVTHDITLANMCDIIFQMQDGKIWQIDKKSNTKEFNNIIK
ncbi:MAG: ABC transporter ATP-binding protein [Bifidobacteriaceae bacterium]|jgi:putative ABC transport system ATP-binding protein|nr:ABC transporter ATP-binding protein [Bifidobacteriaceae bacterium]